MPNMQAENIAEPYMVQHASRRLFWSLLCCASSDVHSPVVIPAARAYVEIEIPLHVVKNTDKAEQLHLGV